MLKKIKYDKIIILFLLVFLFASFAGFCRADNSLEVAYPALKNGGSISSSSPLSAYLEYMFNLGMDIGFLVAVLSIIIAGALYLLSSAVPNLRAAAKDRLYGAITGLILLVLIVLIVTTINPAFKTFQITGVLKPPPPPPPPSPVTITDPEGVHLYTNSGCSTATPPGFMGKSFVVQKIIDKNTADLTNFKNTAKSARVSQGTNNAYIALLYEIINFRGKCQYLDPNAPCVSTIWPAEGINPGGPFASSISVYKYNFNPSGGSITFYRKPNFDKSGGWLKIKGEDTKNNLIKELKTLCFSGDKNSCDTSSCNVPEQEQDCVKWSLDGGECLQKKCPNLSGQNISSIEIDGNYVVTLLYFDPKNSDRSKWATCQIFPSIEDINKAGPIKINWDFIRNQNFLPNWMVIFPVEQN